MGKVDRIFITPEKYEKKKNKPILDSATVWWRPKSCDDLEWPWVQDIYKHAKKLNSFVDIIIGPPGAHPSRKIHIKNEPHDI